MIGVTYLGESVISTENIGVIDTIENVDLFYCVIRKPFTTTSNPGK